MRKQCRRGQIYYASLDPGVGSEQHGYRPVIIIQNNKGNRYSPTVIVASLTSRMDKSESLPTHYVLRGMRGLKNTSVVQLEQIRTIDKSRLKKYIGKVDDSTLAKIDSRLLISFGIHGGS